jgi:hypothetical protein
MEENETGVPSLARKQLRLSLHDGRNRICWIGSEAGWWAFRAGVFDPLRRWRRSHGQKVIEVWSDFVKDSPNGTSVTNVFVMDTAAG